MHEQTSERVNEAAGEAALRISHLASYLARSLLHEMISQLGNLPKSRTNRQGTHTSTSLRMYMYVQERCMRRGRNVKNCPTLVVI